MREPDLTPARALGSCPCLGLHLPDPPGALQSSYDAALNM